MIQNINFIFMLLTTKMPSSKQKVKGLHLFILIENQS